MDGELVEIVLRFQRLQEHAKRLEALTGSLPLRRIQSELELLGAEIASEIDRCTEE